MTFPIDFLKFFTKYNLILLNTFINLLLVTQLIELTDRFSLKSLYFGFFSWKY